MLPIQRRYPLASQLAWFIRLRWIAGTGVVAGALVDRIFFHQLPFISIFAIGGTLLLANLGMWLLLAKLRQNRNHRGLFRLATVQMVLDLFCLSLLVSWTGGLDSPILSLFVLHMVFASLLLPRSMAYAAVFVAGSLLVGALSLADRLPKTAAQMLHLSGMTLTLILTVMLTTHITRDLRRHRRRLIKQNRRIRRMSRRLRIHQRALIRQEKMVALGQLAAGVAHEITNPLASMDSLLQLAQRKPEANRGDIFEKLRAQIARISTIIQQMRQFSHPAQGDAQVLPLNTIVAQAVEIVRIDTRTEKVRITTDLSNSFGISLVRPQALQQVIVNLIINALDALVETADPHIRISTRRQDRWNLIEVADNGPGIKPEHLNRIFEPFFTTKPVGKGTGLGLSISYNLIRRQNGRIDVQSTPGGGATFTVRLPAVVGADPPAAGNSTALAAAAKHV